MAALGAQTIASSYEQLLHTDTDGGGNGNTLVTIKDGDNGTTFGIKLATNKVEIIPGSDDANAFEVSQADGTAVFTVNTSSPAFTLTGDATLGNSSSSALVTIKTTGSSNHAGLSLEAPASGTGDPYINFKQGSGDGSANNMNYQLVHDTSEGYFKFRSADSDGSSTDADVWRVVDGTDDFIIPSGKLGIGTTTMDAFLNINSGADNSGLHVESTDGGANLSLADNSGSVVLQGLGGALVVEVGGSAGTAGSSASEGFRIDSSGRVGIAQDTPGDFDAGSDDLVIGNSSGNRGMTIRCGTSNSGTIAFADGTTGDQAYRGIVAYDHSTDSLQFKVNGASEKMRINSTGFVGIGTNAQQKMLHIERGDTDCMIILDSSNSASDKQICFAEDYVTGNETGGDYWGVGVDASEGPDFVIAFDANAQASMGGDDDKLRIKTTGLVVINQGANDGSILEFKSSDVAHGMTDNYETDTYAAFSKSSATNGGFRLEGYSESKEAILLDGISSTDNTTKSTSAQGNVMIRAWKKSSNSWSTIEADGNLLTVGNGNAVRFVFDEDGDFHYDSSAVAYDSYNDAQLVRAFDSTMSPKNIIQSKWDEFVTYKEKDLVEANLLGKVSNEEKAEGVKPLVNLTGMSRLHNGAIWQQYTEMQKMKELMYDAMVELMGKEKADKKLKNHDVSLLNNKDLLN